ncbi:hypothetical protein KBD08_01990 [Candidatus Babeliales bacterium]|nr:hypothetical protein [Candidatus Babeliales bacterium]
MKINRVLLCTVLAVTTSLCPDINLSRTQSSSSFFSDSIPLQQLITLEMLEEKVTKHQRELRSHWDSLNSQFIVQAAELELNLAPQKVRSLIMQNIIAMFADINISVTIWPDNTITRDFDRERPYDDTVDHQRTHLVQKSTHPKNATTQLQIKRFKHSEKSTSSQPTLKKPERIHGAGRTLKKIKKRLELYKKQREERIKKYRLEEQEAIAKKAMVSHQDVDEDDKETALMPRYQEIEL